MADTAYWYTYLAQPTDEQVHEFILNQFVVLWDEYDKARKAVPEGNLVIAYEELTADPVGTISRIYGKLGIEGFEEHVKHHEAAVNRPTVKGHKVNEFKQLPPELKEIVSKRWAAYGRVGLQVVI